MACDGRFTAAHAQMCRLHLDAYDHLTAEIAELDALVARGGRAVRRADRPAVTIPGIGQRTAEVIVAETGGDMARFATAPGWPPGPGWRPATTSPPASASTPPPARATGTCARR